MFFECVDWGVEFVVGVKVDDGVAFFDLRCCE